MNGSVDHRGSRLGLAVATLACLTAFAATLASGPVGAADGEEASGSAVTSPMMSAGRDYTCAVDRAGSLRCWGQNETGQLGLGDTATRGDGPDETLLNLAPVSLGSGRTATAVATSSTEITATGLGQHTCAVLDDGTVKCWGNAVLGSLGLGDTQRRGDGPGEMGDNLPTVNLGTGRTATAITAGGGHTCALLDNGTVKCWGRNSSGQLGLGHTQNLGASPGQMGDDLPPVDLGTGRTATAIAAGTDHTCALLDNGSVKCWGLNSSGQLGLGNNLGRGGSPGQMGDSLPPVDLGTDRTATAIAAGVHYTCAVLDDGTAKCWGSNFRGALGLGDAVNRGDGPNEMGEDLPAIDLGTGRTATAITAGTALNDVATCAVLDDGTVKCWGVGATLGLGDQTIRGDGPGEMGDSLPAVELGSGRTAVDVTSGAFHACAVLDNLTAKCWGNNARGALGVGDTLNRGDGPGEMGDALPVCAVLGAGIGGRVTGGGAVAVSGALVVALRSSDFSVAGGAAAAPNGRYQFAVAPGDYFVYVVDPSATHSPGFVGAPTETDVAQVTTIVDPSLTPRTGTIAGTVTEEGSAAPIPYAEVVALNEAGSVERAAAASAGGTFELTRLTPGPHHLVYLDPGGAHRVVLGSPAPVSAGVTTAGDASLPTQPSVGRGAAVTGRITQAGTGTAIPGVLVVSLEADDLSFARSTHTSASGNYALDLAPGSYKLLFVDPNGRHLPESYDDRPVSGVATAPPVDVPAVANASLSPTTGSMAGTITIDGRPAAAAWVVAIGANGVAGAATSDGSGSYRIDGLPPGNYRAGIVHALTGLYEYWIDGTGYENGTLFRVVAGDVTGIDADL